MLSFIIGVIAVLLFFALVYAIIVFLLKNIFKVAIILFILFLSLIYLAATDQLPKPSESYQKQINSPISN